MTVTPIGVEAAGGAPRPPKCARTRVLRWTGIIAPNVPSAAVVARATVTHALLPSTCSETGAPEIGAPSVPSSAPETWASAGGAPRGPTPARVTLETPPPAPARPPAAQ